MVSIQETNVDGIMGAREFPALIEEYARESAIDGMPKPLAKIESYKAYEGMGMLHAFAALKDSALVGFIAVLAPILPHYSIPVAVAESFFVTSIHRKGGAGLRLLEVAEERAKALGSPGLLVCAPFGGRLFEVLPRRGYTETNRVFFKKVGDE